MLKPEIEDEYDLCCCGDDHDHEDHDATTGTYLRMAPKVGRNDPCPCDSGKKYKKCCLM